MIESDSALNVIAFQVERWQNAYGSYRDIEFGPVQVDEGNRAWVRWETEGDSSEITAYFNADGSLDTMIDDCAGHLNVVFFGGEYVGGEFHTKDS